MTAQHAWFSVWVPGSRMAMAKLCIAMTEKAWDYCFARYGDHEPVLFWDEFVAWARACNEAPEEPTGALQSKFQLMESGLRHFGSRISDRASRGAWMNKNTGYGMAPADSI